MQELTRTWILVYCRYDHTGIETRAERPFLEGKDDEIVDLLAWDTQAIVAEIFQHHWGQRWTAHRRWLIAAEIKTEAAKELKLRLSQWHRLFETQ